MPTASDCLHAVPPRLRTALQPSGRLYVVGGFVRDVLLGRPTRDLDVAVDGDAAAVARAIARVVGGAVVALDPERGTYRIALREPDDGIAVVDLTRLRGPTIEADLAARDFTINAIAVRLTAEDTGLIDPTGGIADLTRRMVRVASPDAFTDDPVRLLRAVRFTVQPGFELHEATAALAREQAGLLVRSAAERQRDELAQILRCDDAARGVRLLHELGLLFTLLPDLEAAVGCTQPKEHYFDVFEHCLHTLAALDLMLRRESGWQWTALWERFGVFPEVRRRLDEVVAEERPRYVSLKLAGLLHDVSKPETKAVDPRTGRTRFFGHDELGAGRTAMMARALRFSSREVQYMEQLVREHLRPGMLAAPGEVPTRRALFRFARDLGGAVPELLLLNLADHAAARGPELTEREWRRHVDFAAWVLRMLYVESNVVHPPKLVNGDDLMRELGLRPGPTIGRLLDTVQEAQAAGEVSTREEALALARETLIEAGGEAPPRVGG